MKLCKPGNYVVGWMDFGELFDDGARMTFDEANARLERALSTCRSKARIYLLVPMEPKATKRRKKK